MSKIADGHEERQTKGGMRAMCVSTPKVEPAPPPPSIETVDPSGNTAANRDAERRRRRYAQSRASTRSGGAMQGPDAAGLKTA
jgi:hypothetical protein